MKPLDHNKLADAMVAGAQRYIDAQIGAILKRLEAAEAAVASHETMERMVAAAVSKAVAAIPPAEPGKSVTVEDCRQVIEEAAAKAAADAMARMPVPQDGAGYTDALIDRDGALVLTRDDGTTVKLGVIVPKALTPADVQPLIDEAVGKAVAALPPAEPGKSVDPAEVERMIAEHVTKAVTAIPAFEPLPPAEIDMKAVAEMVRAEVADAVKAIPPVEPLPPAEIDMKAVAEMVRAEVADAVKAIPPVEPPALPDIPALVKAAVDALPKPKDGDPGASVTVDDVRPLIEQEVARKVGELPKPEDGKSIAVEDVEPLLTRLVSEAVKAIPAPVGFAKGMLNDAGHLILIRTDGSTEDIGRVKGEDADGDSMMETLSKRLEEAIAAIPVPQDGKDGLGFDDLTVGHDGEREIILRFARGDIVKEFTLSLPVVLDRGVWAEGKPGGYAKGDGVSWGGSFWISQKDGNSAKPDAEGGGWRLAVKRGRDGKEVVKL